MLVVRCQRTHWVLVEHIIVVALYPYLYAYTACLSLLVEAGCQIGLRRLYELIR